MTAAPIDPGHLLPADAWAAVVAAAEAEAERIAAGRPAPEAPGEWEASRSPGRYATGLALPLSGAVVARSAGGVRPGWAPTFGVLHSAETPLRAGYAASLARNWFDEQAPTSCHYITDPAETWGVLPDERIAWHCGNGNTNSIGLEQAGYARFSRAEWTTPDGWAQMRRNAAVMRACRDRYGIGLHWMTDAELLAAHRRQIVGGWATHDQCRSVLGGTEHTDPMPNFPLQEQMALAIGEDDDMPLTRDDAITVWSKGIAGEPAEVHLKNAGVNAAMAVSKLDTLTALVTKLAAQAPDVDEAALAREMVPLLAPLVVKALGDDLGLTDERIDAALRRVFADAATA